MGYVEVARPPDRRLAGPVSEWMADCLFADMIRSVVPVRTKRSTPVRSNHLVRHDPTGYDRVRGQPGDAGRTNDRRSPNTGTLLSGGTMSSFFRDPVGVVHSHPANAHFESLEVKLHDLA
jgi:hypothetical protein